mmetsp:Transcript_68082/g.168208  ORF Transcript_68082/g.168208 Transcript_68082/m.168208 type:complete len:386 (+) Transcript_68082:1-1158(+)
MLRRAGGVAGIGRGGRGGVSGIPLRRGRGVAPARAGLVMQEAGALPLDPAVVLEPILSTVGEAVQQVTAQPELGAVLVDAFGAPADRFLEVAMYLPVSAWEGYNTALQNNALRVDVVLTVFLYTLGQVTLGGLTGKMSPASVFQRWAFFGAMDGFLTHHWYHFIRDLADFIVGPGASQFKQVSAMVFTTSTLYTPAYCFLFLAISALWDGQGIKGVKQATATKLPIMAQATLPTWTLFNTFLFAFVPLEFRVLAAEAFHYVYLVFLALWEQKSGVSTHDHGFGSEPAQVAPVLASVAENILEAIAEIDPNVANGIPPPESDGAFGVSQDLGAMGSSFNTWSHDDFGASGRAIVAMAATKEPCEPDFVPERGPDHAKEAEEVEAKA